MDQSIHVLPSFPTANTNTNTLSVRFMDDTNIKRWRHTLPEVYIKSADKCTPTHYSILCELFHFMLFAWIESHRRSSSADAWISMLTEMIPRIWCSNCALHITHLIHSSWSVKGFSINFRWLEFWISDIESPIETIFLCFSLLSWEFVCPW